MIQDHLVFLEAEGLLIAERAEERLGAENTLCSPPMPSSMNLGLRYCSEVLAMCGLMFDKVLQRPYLSLVVICISKTDI